MKGIDIEDEYIKVRKDEILFDIIKRMQSTDVKIMDHDDQMYTPILAAYVIEDGKLLGVIHHEDIIDEVILKNKDVKQLKAEDIMHQPVICHMTQKVIDVINLIVDKGLLTVAICDGEHLVSVISVYDAIFLKDIIDHL